jgi:hypothetical protein
MTPQDVMYAAFADEMEKISGLGLKGLGLMGLGAGGMVAADKASDLYRAGSIQLEQERMAKQKRRLNRMQQMMQLKEGYSV